MYAEQVIRDHLKNNGLKISYVAEKINMSNDLLGKSLNGRRMLKADELVDICQVLGLTLDMFRKNKSCVQ